MTRLPFLADHHEGWVRRGRAAAAALVTMGLAQAEERSREIVRELGSRGLFDCFLAGAKPDARALCLVRSELAYESALADAIFAVQGLGTVPLLLSGDALQREAYLPAARRGQFIGGFALTEPEAGSDLRAIACRAARDGDDYVITGVKTLISNAPIADYLVLFARTGEGSSRFLSAFVVPRDAPGRLEVKEIELMAPHPIGEVVLDEVRVPRRNLLGEEGDGLRVALTTLDTFRPSVGAAALGLMRRAMDEALSHARRRRQFDRPLLEHQGIAWMLAEMAADRDASELLVLRAAWLLDTGAERATLESAMAKWQATEAAQRVIDRALQIHGGRGVVRGVVVERLYREIRALRIYEGTTEVQKSIIARELGRQEPGAEAP